MKRPAKTPRRPTTGKVQPKVVRQVVQIIPADPGCHAPYADDEGPATTPVVCPVVSFGLIEIRLCGEPPDRHVVPMVVHEDSLIEDVHYRDGFIDLIPPCLHGSAHSHDEAGHPGVLEQALGEVHS